MVGDTDKVDKIYYYISISNKGILLITSISLSTTYLNISWELSHGTPISYTISYHNTDTHCSNDSDVILDIDGNETVYTLTGLKGGSEYSITMTFSICETEEIMEETFLITALPSGQETLQDIL